jgi:hypothetical protein
MTQPVKVPPDQLRLRIGTCRSAGLVNDEEALALMDAVAGLELRNAVQEMLAALEKPAAQEPQRSFPCLCQMDDEMAGRALEAALAAAARSLLASGVQSAQGAALLVWCKPEGPKVISDMRSSADDVAQALTVASLCMGQAAQREAAAARKGGRQ